MAVQRKGKEPSLDEKPADQEVRDLEINGDLEINEICIEIKKLGDKPSRSTSDSFIFKVPYQLRQVKESAHEPRIISIGPYHRGKPHLKAMEFHKWRYFDMLLKRTNGDSAVYVEAMKNLENDARSCYAESLDHMSSQEFVQMLVLDGFFIIELIRKLMNYEFFFEEDDDPFMRNFNLRLIGQELLLVENQLPFFVLDKLFKMTKTQSEDDEALVKMTLEFFSAIVEGAGIPVVNYDGRTEPIKHLIGLVHDSWLPSSEGIKRYQKRVTDTYQNSMRSAKELLEFGIKFKKVTGDSSFFNIKFDDKGGRLQIPTLRISHDTERLFRSLIAYEQFNEGRTHFMDYARFMGCLINDGEDVKLLSLCGIIDNWLGTNEEVAHMFNKLNDFVYLSKTDLYYSRSSIFLGLDTYCRSQSWKASLRDKYFRTPWEWVLASIAVGAILLLLAFMQTVFTVLSYFKQ